jgi:hypothetical protein
MTQDTLDVAAAAVPSLLTRVRHTSTPEPSGCRWCGTGERQHASRFAPSVGQHLFDDPTAAQRLARMRARRVGQR